MSIIFDSEYQTITLNTAHTTYQMQLGPVGHLMHLYYGRRASGCFEHLYIPRDRGFSPNPYEFRLGRGWSVDTLPQEYSGSNTGDYRCASIELSADSGVCGAELRYVRHEIREGKYDIPGLPAAYAEDGEAQTLSVTLTDTAAGIEVELLYGVFASCDVITRAVRITNTGSGNVRIEKAASACLDLPFGKWDMIHFHGRHTMERMPERSEIGSGVHSISSRRGMTSHQHNPFVILCEHTASEERGDCFGSMLVYSGSHKTDVELDQNGSVRLVTGIQDEGFSWMLMPGESFYTPEAILAFTPEGFSALSHIFHRFIRAHIVRNRRMQAYRPVLLNSWEAAYFDFDADKLVKIAEGAKKLGADLFVMDDGWFGARNDDFRALGDWTANEEKLPGGLAPLIERVKVLGLSFGIWVEPEMVSEDSTLYRSHPDWAMTVPGRKPAMSRDQLVLDLSRAEVVDWLHDTLAALLTNYDISYVKWDMNRSLSDVYSRALPADRQGEVNHRYMLGLYGVLERLTRAFPDVLFEGCAGGGGRFDAGMLAYFPQIWCSDNTDPVSRSAIQYGTSYGYPISSIGAHVSASPNHQTGRSTPLGTRGVAAMCGSFGYELDPGALGPEELREVCALTERFRRYGELIHEGLFYRLSAPETGCAAWQHTAADRSEALLSFVITEAASNPRPVHIRLRGLDPDAVYALRDSAYFGCRNGIDEAKASVFSGAALMYGGITLPPMFGDYPSAQLYFQKQ